MIQPQPIDVDTHLTNILSTAISASSSCKFGKCKTPINLGTFITGALQPILSRCPKEPVWIEICDHLRQNYSEFDKLEYSISRNAVFCYMCRLFPPSSNYTGRCFYSYWC